MHQQLQRVFAEATDYLRPSERISTADFAVKYRRMNNAGGGHQGEWSNSIAPYGVGIMDAFDDHMVSCVSVVGPGQSSKSVLAENYLFHTIVSDPCNVLWYNQTEKSVQSMVKNRINTMIEDHFELSSRIGHRPIDDSVSFKKFRGCSVEFLTATRSNLISKSAPRIIADEIDAYPAEIGDVRIQLNTRMQTFMPSAKLLLISHPDLATGIDPEGWGSGIMANYKDSDRNVWWWPHVNGCGKWSSPNPGIVHHMALHYPSVINTESPATLDEVQRDARLICPHCDGQIADHERRDMNSHGKWVSSFCEVDPETGVVTGETPPGRDRGFWIVGAMSPFCYGGIGGLARAVAKAEADAEKTGDFSSLKEVYVKQLGFPFKRRTQAGGTVDAETIAERAKHNRWTKGTVPEGVRFLVMAVDVQVNRLEYLVRGFGVDSESWVVDYDMLPGDPSRELALWDKLIGLFTKQFPLADGSGRRMKVRALTMDSGGAPGVTQMAYDKWRAWKAHGFARKLPANSGKDVWSVICAKGVGTLNSAPLRVSYPDQQSKQRQTRSLGLVPLMLYNANVYKDALAGMIERDSGPTAIHFPSWMCSKEPPHRLFEQIVSSEIRENTGRWRKAAQGARNEMLDLLVMSHAVADLHYLKMIDWAKPPGWAKPWPENNMITFDVVPEGPVVREKTTLQKLMEL